MPNGMTPTSGEIEAGRVRRETSEKMEDMQRQINTLREEVEKLLGPRSQSAESKLLDELRKKVISANTILRLTTGDEIARSVVERFVGELYEMLTGRKGLEDAVAEAKENRE